MPETKPFKPIKITRRISVTLTIDGQPIEATVTRLSLEQSAAFHRDFQRTQSPRAELLLLKRQPGEGWDIPDAEIRRRRLLEMTDEQRDEYERVAKEDEAFALQFLTDSLTRYLTLAPGQVQTVDDAGQEQDVTAGADFVRTFGGRSDVLFAALRAVTMQRETPAPSTESATPPAAEAAAP